MADDLYAELARLIGERVAREYPSARLIGGDLREVLGGAGGRIDDSAMYARVHLDGDPDDVLIVATLLGRAPTEPGTRVAVLLNPPHGAFILDGFGALVDQDPRPCSRVASSAAQFSDTVAAYADGMPGHAYWPSLVTIEPGPDDALGIGVTAVVGIDGGGSGWDLRVFAVVDGVTLDSYSHAESMQPGAATPATVTLTFVGIAAGPGVRRPVEVGWDFYNYGDAACSINVALNVHLACLNETSGVTLHANPPG